MTEVNYHILSLYPDENGFYPGEDDDMYFTPTVGVTVKWREENGTVHNETFYMNFLAGEDHQEVEYLC